MLSERLLVAIVLIPLGVAAIVVGGPIFTLVIALIVVVAAWEYVRIFRSGGYSPAGPLVYVAVLAIVICRSFFNFAYSDLIITLVVLAAMTYHLVAYERGNDKAATDFTVTLGGILYLGWLGAFFLSLRNIPDGKWWLLQSIATVVLADTGGYIAGSLLGKHKFSPRLSPHKTWEGYIGQIIFGAAGGVLLAALFGLACPAITLLKGGILGGVLGVLTPLGDLGESMIKRQFGFKDSSHVIPGHGGVMDRIDSWIWAVALSYYIITTLW